MYASVRCSPTKKASKIKEIAAEYKSNYGAKCTPVILSKTIVKNYTNLIKCSNTPRILSHLKVHWSLDSYVKTKCVFTPLFNCLSRPPLCTQCKLWISRSLCISWPNLTLNKSLDMQGLCYRGACVIKRWLSIFNTLHVCTCTLI